jgi:hypothetical protein
MYAAKPDDLENAKNAALGAKILQWYTGSGKNTSQMSPRKAQLLDSALPRFCHANFARPRAPLASRRMLLGSGTGGVGGIVGGPTGG